MDFKKLKEYTSARIGLGHSGGAMPTGAWLEFSFAHALAQDAVHVDWDKKVDLSGFGLKIMELTTQVADREEFLLRPDKGRLLDSNSRQQLLKDKNKAQNSLVIYISNGLSTLAIQNQLAGLLHELIPMLRNIKLDIRNETVFVIKNARVGLIDDIGESLKPLLGLCIIGERPGLSSPDSLAMYLTYKPVQGLNDASRNCISNIKEGTGLSYKEAAFKMIYLIQEARRRQLSGVMLKDESSFLIKDKGE